MVTRDTKGPKARGIKAKSKQGRLPFRATPLRVERPFYVGAARVLREDNDWACPTMEAAVEHAKQILEEDDTVEEVPIVQIIRIVRRKHAPVEVVRVAGS